jgi:hypothetical protein
MPAPDERATDEHSPATTGDEVGAALGQVIDGYRTRLRSDVTSIRVLIGRGRFEEALEALEEQRRSLQVAAACLDGVVAEATAGRPREQRRASRWAGQGGSTLAIGAFVR